MGRGCDEDRNLPEFAVTRATVKMAFMMYSDNSMIRVKRFLADPVLVLQYFSVDGGN